MTAGSGLSPDAGAFAASLRIRPAGEQDAGRITELESEIFSDAWSRASVESHLAGRVNLALAAEAEGSRVIGYLLGMKVLDEAEIYRVAVDPAARRSGIGGRLLEAFLSEVSPAGTAPEEPVTVSLEVRAGNTPAIRMYEKAGFRKTGTRKEYYRDPTEDAVLMRLEA